PTPLHSKEFRMLASWLSRWARRTGRTSPRRQGTARPRAAGFWPRLEALEDRLAPATLTVNSAADNTTADGVLTLREAVLLVNNGGDATAALSRSLMAGEAAQV